MRRGAFGGALALVVVLAGCTTHPVRPAPVAGVDEQAVNALYARLDQASLGYDAALQLAESGRSKQSEHALDQALDDLKDASAKCGSTPGCDPQRFLSVYDRLLRLKDGSFVAGSESVVEEGADDQGTAGEGSTPVTEAVPQTQRTVTLLHGHKLSELIAMNGPVKEALEEWLTWRRPKLVEAWENYQYLRYRMWPEYRKAGLPEAVLFGILAKESDGKVHAVSRSGAVGPLQFMYTTGLRFGLTTVDGFDQRFDPTLSARANAAYLDEQLKVFNDNLELTLAAYNGGEGRLRRLAASKPGASFYDPDIYFSLSPETRDYVPLVLAAAWLFLHPDSYHLQFPSIDGEPGQIVLQRQASLSELSVCLGQAGDMRDGWFRTLRNLNPRLDPQNELPAGTRLQVPQLLEKPYAESCVDGPWPILAADLHAGTVPTPPPSRHYTVRRGDNLGRIARRFGCSSVSEVARRNHLRGPHYMIRAGQVLTLPDCSR